MVNFLLITHGEFGAYVFEAAEEIVGRQKGVRVVSISPRLSLEEIRQRAAEAIRAVYDKKDGLIVVTDMVGGTPSNVALPLIKDLSNVSVISGLNLYMLVSAFGQRKVQNRLQLTDAMIRNGQRSIQDIGKKFLSHAHSSCPD